jgi:hypothetical protein
MLFGAGETGKCNDLSGILDPSRTRRRRRRRQPRRFEMETRDFPTGQGQPNHLKRIRLRYTRRAPRRSAEPTARPDRTRDTWVDAEHQALTMPGEDPVAWWLPTVPRGCATCACASRRTGSEPLDRASRRADRQARELMPVSDQEFSGAQARVAALEVLVRQLQGPAPAGVVASQEVPDGREEEAKYPHKWPTGAITRSRGSRPSARRRAPERRRPAPMTRTSTPSWARIQPRAARICSPTSAAAPATTRSASARPRAGRSGDSALARSGRHVRAGWDYDTATGNVETGYPQPLRSPEGPRAGHAGLRHQRRDAAAQLPAISGRAGRGAAQGGRVRGVRRGPAGARKRAANEAIDRAPIDTAYSASSTPVRPVRGGSARTSRATGRAQARLRPRRPGPRRAAARSSAYGFQRQDQDWATQLERAKREAGAFGDDILNAKVAQFTQNNPGRRCLIYPDVPTVSAPPPAPGMSTLGAGPGFPGSTLKKKKNKRGQTIGTYTNSVTGP